MRSYRAALFRKTAEEFEGRFEIFASNPAGFLEAAKGNLLDIIYDFMYVAKIGHPLWPGARKIEYSRFVDFLMKTSQDALKNILIVHEGTAPLVIITYLLF